MNPPQPHLLDPGGALVGEIVHPLAECCRTTPVVGGDCATLRAVAANLLAVADRCDAHAARVRDAPVPDTTPAAAFVVTRNDRAADLMRVAEDIRGALTDALGRARHA